MDAVVQLNVQRDFRPCWHYQNHWNNTLSLLTVRLLGVITENPYEQFALFPHGRFLACITSCVLIACSTASPIAPATQGKSGFDGAVYAGETTVFEESQGREEFRVFHQAATGFVSVESVRQSATKRADDFCRNRGQQKLIFRETTSTPPHILGNFPRIELIFGCRAGGSPTEDKQARYEAIAKLKGLLDANAITQDEYNREKAKVLGTP